VAAVFGDQAYWYFPASIVLALVLASCAENPSAQENDPLEPTNRAIFDVNDALDKAVALPVAQAYVDVVPDFARNGVHNFLENLGSPVTFANDILQGEIDRAGETLARLAVNSTLGIGGLIDVGADLDIPPHTEDFGQTLGTYGVGEGPYLVLPLLGPSNPRDAIGSGVDLFFDPLTYAKYNDETLWSALRIFGTFLDTRSRNIDSLEAVERSSIDYYAALRSLYRQQRDNEIRNNKQNTQSLPEF
jgi:phospholipid-binding lipoprotein MlaA